LVHTKWGTMEIEAYGRKGSFGFNDEERVLPANLLDNANALADKGLGYNASRQQSRQQRSICVST